MVITVAGSNPELLTCAIHFASSGFVIVSVTGAGASCCVVDHCICWSSGVDFCVIHVPILINVSPIILRVERKSCDLPLLGWPQLFVQFASFGCLGSLGCLRSMDVLLSLLFRVLPPLASPPRPLVRVSLGLCLVKAGEYDSVKSVLSSSWVDLLSNCSVIKG